MDQEKYHSMPVFLVLLVGTLAQITPSVTGFVREYYVAAVISDWDYSNAQNQSSEYVFKKMIYREYEQGFQKAKPASKLSGILGPTLRAEVGDHLKVHFKNMASKPLTIHPQGITYGKRYEGARYADGTSPLEKMDDSVLPGETYTYNWDITEDMGPEEGDPDCLTSIYYSMENMVQDMNSGLIGALLICKKGSLNNNGAQKHFDKDFILMFAVFDESKSWQNVPSTKQRPLMYTVNGYVRGTGPDFTACVNDKISWHLLGMSSKPEFFSVHFFGQSLEQNHHKVSVISLAGTASTTANMTITQSGRWMISSLVEKHLEVGMQGYFDVQPCVDTEEFALRKSVFQTRYIKRWDHYIAAVEVDWNYDSGSSESTEKMYCQHPFKKVIYKQYTDSTFKLKVDNPKELGLIGPVIRAQVKDTIMVVFKNMASQPHNIYPHGVSLLRFFKGLSLNLKGEETQNNTVMPGETMTYYWTILENDEPTKSDPQCLTRIYHSTVNIVKDIASGLLGTLLICKSMALNTRGMQEKADEEQIAMFTVFDENKSWYYEANKPKPCNKVLSKDETSLYNSYVINSINGISFENAILGFCNNHVVQWHISSVGVLDETITLQLSGHTFRYRGRNGDIMTLFPMTGESITIEMNNQGVWIFGDFNFKGKQGTKLRFRDAKCESEENYYDFVDDAFSFDYPRKPETRSGTDDTSEEQLHINSEDLDYNEHLAAMFDIRSRRNNTGAVEEVLNLTALAIEEMSETYTDNVHVPSPSNTSMKYDSDSSESNEDEYIKDDMLEGGQYIHNNSNLATGPTEEKYNSTEGPLSPSIQNGTDSLSEQNNILSEDDNGFTAYLEESASGEEVEEEESIQMKINISQNTQSIKMSKRDVENFTGNSTDNLLDLNDAGNNQSESLNTVLNSNISDGYQFLTNEISQFTEQNEVTFKTEVTSTYSDNNPKISIASEVGLLPTGTALSFPQNDHPDFTTPRATDENTSTQMVASDPPYDSNDDYHDLEIRDLLGADVYEEIMNAMFHQKQSNETDSKEKDNHAPSQENLEDKFDELQNQSLPSSNSTMPEKHHNQNEKVKKKISYKIMQTFQISEIGNNTSETQYIRRKKRVGNMKNKRTAMKNRHTNIHFSNDNQTESDEHVSSNVSLPNNVGNITFSPRGLNPRGLNPRGFNSSRLKAEIVIGISRGFDGDYKEYDHDFPNYGEEKAKPQYILYEEPYKIESEDDVKRYTNPDMIINNYLRSSKGIKRIYYIAAEEVQWDYSGQAKRSTDTRGTVFTKAVFRKHIDGTFTKSDTDGEYEEHLGILGPVIRAEVEDVIQVTFKNLASRPYSLHAHGVSYEKSSEGYSYDDETKEWLKKDDAVQPGETHIYVWYAAKQSGPEPEESACRTWAYYSGVDTEKDIHSGLLGPLLICRNGTLDGQSSRPLDAREFILLFMSFEEEKSWYFEKNSKKRSINIAEKSSSGLKCYTFHAINGIIYNLQGLQMYENELVRWHLLNMGSPKDIHVVSFHGQTVTEKLNTESRHAVYPLIPGTFATIEMKPSRQGLWRLDTEVAEYQQAGMQTIFNIVEQNCNFPLGLASRIISDDQITASHYLDHWEPKLARLNNLGSYNAWSAHLNKSSLPWIQVDLQKIFLISGIQTQGANKYFSQYYITQFFVVYSKDKKKWTTFRGNSTVLHKLFDGNVDSTSIKENLFDPPIAARYIRVYPTKFFNQLALRMELLGCEIQGCSAPLGMENYNIQDAQITASSYKSSWYSSSWLPYLARLNKLGSVNAWQAKSNNNQQWLEIDFLETKKLTGITTQGARYLTSEMYVEAYSVQYSDNGRSWKSYMDDSTSMEKIFKGNRNNFAHVRNEFNPPIYSRYLRIIPKSWKQSIVMRLEIYGCDI
ncbi:coagulation factor V [Mixophyes fleayi]|uniref:coagulation factor V n=1 Tax=Mixophyes fleayi TaxID=3061075 RepID=UPI003F4DE51E